MSEPNEAGSPSRGNPIIWISLIVVALILYVVFSGDRSNPASVASVDTGLGTGQESSQQTAGTIDRSLLVPPGMRAREYIEQLRDGGKPYPLSVVYDKAENYLQQGSLADAHLLHFFAAREDHIPSIVKMGEMSDPMLFEAENALLDNADVIQAYKWYGKAAALGHQPAQARIDNLRQWAVDESELGNPYARQLLLNLEQVVE